MCTLLCFCLLWDYWGYKYRLWSWWRREDILVSGMLSETDVSLSTSIPSPGWYFTNSLLHEKHVFYFGFLTVSLCVLSHKCMMCIEWKATRKLSSNPRNWINGVRRNESLLYRQSVLILQLQVQTHSYVVYIAVMDTKVSFINKHHHFILPYDFQSIISYLPCNLHI